MIVLCAIRNAQADRVYVRVSPLKTDTEDIILEPDVFPMEINDITIQTTLSSYGYWIKTDEYGIVWRPFVAVRESSWHPYCHNGRWIPTNHGLFWHSYYPWGWVAFHYGRWFLHQRLGWVWIPDKYWGPAWVVWRSSQDYCGWAPLPPCYDSNTSIEIIISPRAFVFVPYYRVYMPYILSYVLSPQDCINIYHQTVIIQNADGRMWQIPSRSQYQPSLRIVQPYQESFLPRDSRTIRVMSTVPVQRVSVPTASNPVPPVVPSNAGRLERIINVLSSQPAVINQSGVKKQTKVQKSSVTTSSPVVTANKASISGTGSSSNSRVSRIIRSLSAGR